MHNINIDLLVTRYKELNSLEKTRKEFGLSYYFIRKFLKEKIELNHRGNNWKYNCDEDFFSRDTPESFYWAGFIAADGCIYGKELRLNVAKKDLDHLKKFVNEIKFEGNILKAKWHDNYGFQIGITSDKIVKDLERFNITPKKSLVYAFPAWLINHSIVNHFMRGYFDGDGTVGMYLKKAKKTRSFNFNILGTKNFIDIFALILENKCQVHLSIIKRENIYMGAFGGNQKAKLLRDFLYKDVSDTICLIRKRDIFWSPEIGNYNHK